MAPTHLLLKMFFQWLDPPLLICALRDFNCYYELTLLCYIRVTSRTKKLKDILRTCTGETQPLPKDLEPGTSCSYASTEPQSLVLYSQSQGLDVLLDVPKQANAPREDSPVLSHMAVSPAKHTRVPNERCTSVTPEGTGRACAHQSHHAVTPSLDC